MNKSKLLLGLTVITFFVLSFINCETTYIPLDNIEGIEYIQGNTMGTVILQIFDSHSNTPLDSALVEIIGGDSVISDPSGTVLFDSVAVGNYIVYCRKGGYEPIAFNLEITIDENSNTVPVFKQSADMLFLAKMGVSINGSIYYENKDVKQFANGAIVECKLIPVIPGGNILFNFLEPVRTTVVQNGSFFFYNLPEYTTYNISVLPFSAENKLFKQPATTVITSDASGDTIPVPSIVLNPVPNDKFVIFSHNLEDLSIGDSIRIVFSEPVDISKLTADSIVVTNINTKVLVNWIWSPDYTQLVIVPFNGTWSIAENYNLTIKKIQSATEKVLDNSDFTPYVFSPNLSGALGNVQNLHYRVGASDTNKVDFNTTNIFLIWSPLSNVEFYEIYRKLELDSCWYLLTTSADTIKPTNTSGCFNDGMSVNYLVLGKNSASISPLETAAIITVRDEKGPIISYNLIALNFNNSGNTFPDTVTKMVTSTYITEPMDTSKAPIVSVIEASYFDGFIMLGDSTYKVSSSKCTWTWTSTRSGNLDVVIDPLANGAYDTLKINFRGLTDVAQNPVDTTNGGGFINYQTR